MSTTSPRRARRRVALGGALVATALASITASAPAAAAAHADRVAAWHWGVKQSFRTYIVNIVGGTITPSDGATFEGLGTTAPYRWSGNGGTYDPAANAGTVDFAGKVVFSAPADTIWHITLAHPTVVLDGDSSAVLMADVS